MTGEGEMPSPPPAPSGDSMDDVIALYKRDIDRTLLRENLKRTVTERLERLAELRQFAVEVRHAGRKAFATPSVRETPEP